MTFDEIVDRTKRLLFQRQRAYQTVFNSPVGEAVLADLAKFCRAHQSTFHADPRVAAQLDGRREVWLRITQHMKLTQEQLWRLYGRADI